jgi:hypothetical protein
MDQSSGAVTRIDTGRLAANECVMSPGVMASEPRKSPICCVLTWLKAVASAAAMFAAQN